MTAMTTVKEIRHELLFALSGVKSTFIYEQQVTVKEVMSKSELALLERITAVGRKYCEIKHFIDMNTCNSSNGFYMLKCAELMGKSLNAYKEIIAGLASQQPCLTLIYSRIYPFTETLSGLLLIVKEISAKESRGCAILEILDKHYNSSTREVQLVIKHVYQGVSEVLISHLQSWLLYGELIDTKKEFFIQKHGTSNHNPFENFSMCYPLLPSFIRPTVAENILTIGQTVLFLRSRPGDAVEVNEKLPIDSSGVTSEEGSKVIECFKDAYKAVPAEKWKLVEMNSEHVASLATRQLHHLAMVDGELLQQIHNIKHVFLMGRGELFHEFVTQTEGTSKSSTALDVNVVLHACARKVLLQEKVLERFSLEEMSGGDSKQLMIKFSVPWPLQLLFTQTVVDTYNEIFRFLMRLKEIQVKMVMAWLNDKRKRRFVSCSKRRQLQQNLWFLVNNLQYYLQVDVLDSQFVTLEAAVISSKSFEDIQIAHSRFLANLVVQSFLGKSQEIMDIANPVQQRLHTILTLCEDFCTQTKLYGDEEMPNGVLEDISIKFNGGFQKLLALLDSLKERGSYLGCQHLNQLLLRLDFNRFFSTRDEKEAG